MSLPEHEVARETIAQCLVLNAGYSKARARSVARALLFNTNKPVAFHDKHQPNGVAWCPGFPEALPDISPLYAMSALGVGGHDGR